MMHETAFNDDLVDIDTTSPAAANAADYDEPAPNLEVIYQAFGEQADLYKDVLQVKPSATAEQIQMAYFDRRSELFALLASIDSEEEQDDITASHRFHAERKMDAVVMAVRILGDPQLRQEYDSVVVLRSSKKQPKEPPSGGGIPSSGASRSSSTREPDGVYAGVGLQVAGMMGVIGEEPSPPRSPNQKRRSPRRRSPRHGPPSDEDSPDELPHHNHHHEQQEDLDYEFVPLNNSTNKKQKGKGKNKKEKKSSKSKHMPKDQKDQHHHSKKKDKDRHPSSPRRHEPGMSEEHPIILNPPLPQPYSNSHHNHQRNNNSRYVDDDTFPDTTLNPDEENTLDNTMDDTKTWDDGATISTAGDWTHGDDSLRLIKSGTSTLGNLANGGFVARIQEEVAGTVEDTLVSFEQVFNAFTLQDRDILAVMGRIDKAKRQLRKRR